MEHTIEKQNTRMNASDLRRRARLVLNGRSGTSSHRLILSLAIILVLVAGMAFYAAMSGLYMAGSILLGETVWLEVVADGLLALLLFLLVLPLATSLWRLAVLMTAPDGETTDGLSVAVPAAELVELFYPFTSLRAYGRTMAVAVELLVWAFLTLGLPLLGFRLLYQLVIPLVATAGILHGLLVAACVFACLALVVGVFFLSGTRAGFGYFVFVHESMTLRDVNRYFRGFRRSVTAVFCLRMGLVGWYALSVAAILMPFVFHTIPYTLCCAAVYSRYLPRR